MKSKEVILCAANYYNDGKVPMNQPKNIKVGFVVCGHRHNNCIGTFAQIVGFPYSKESKVLRKTEVQGFLTSRNRFVNRKEAAKIHIDNGGKLNHFSKELDSSDLY